MLHYFVKCLMIPKIYESNDIRNTVCLTCKLCNRCASICEITFDGCTPFACKLLKYTADGNRRTSQAFVLANADGAIQLRAVLD